MRIWGTHTPLTRMKASPINASDCCKTWAGFPNSSFGYTPISSCHCNVTACNFLNNKPLTLDSFAFAWAGLLTSLIFRHLLHNIFRHLACPPRAFRSTCSISVCIWVRLGEVSHILLVVLRRRIFHHAFERGVTGRSMAWRCITFDKAWLIETLVSINFAHEARQARLRIGAKDIWAENLWDVPVVLEEGFFEN